MHFTGQMAHCFGEYHLEPKEIAPGSNSRINLRNDIFEDIFLTLSDNYSLENLRYASSLLYTFLASLCYLKQFRRYNTQQERIDTTDIVTMAVRYMNENIEKQLTLQQLCDYIGYSVSQFSLIFRKSIGQSPLNYFNRDMHDGRHRRLLLFLATVYQDRRCLAKEIPANSRREELKYVRRAGHIV